MEERKRVEQLINFCEITCVNLHVAISIVEPEEEAEFGVSGSGWMEDREQEEEELEIDAFGLDLLHLIFKKFLDAGVERVRVKEGKLIEVLYL